MPGAAAFLAALAAALGTPSGHAAPTAATLAARAPHVRVVVLPASHPSRLRSCSTTQAQPTATGRKILPVACEQPPRSNVTLPNAASGGLSSFFGH